jgi:FtsP/CotA-like multicopper oxidase with cupredoxin domain
VVARLWAFRKDFVSADGTPSCTKQGNEQTNVTLRIAPVSLEIGPGKVIKTVGYNGSAPGPVLRFREGRPVTIDVFNEADVPETVHWQLIPSAVDGSVEEGTPEIPAHGHRRYRFTPKPRGPPRPQTVDFVYLDIGERVDAIVEMNNPGVWILGSPNQGERMMGWAQSWNTRTRAENRSGNSPRHHQRSLGPLNFWEWRRPARARPHV